MNMRFLAALPLFALLAACPPPPSYQPPPPGGQDRIYSASGNEPGWNLQIQPELIVYIGDYGETEITVGTPEARPSFNGRRYETEAITVDITHTPCDDSMADRSYSDTVRLTIGARELQGCGGTLLPPKSLEDTYWSFETVDGVPVQRERETRMQFLGGKFSGSVGCNGFSGPYKVNGNRLFFEPIMATRMACIGLVGEQENILFGLLASNPEFNFDYLGHMMLKNEKHQIKLKRQF